jgi:hypothetical protein
MTIYIAMPETSDNSDYKYKETVIIRALLRGYRDQLELLKNRGVSLRYVSQYLQETEPRFQTVPTELLAERIRYVIKSKNRYSPEPSKALDELISKITRTANQRQPSPEPVTTVTPDKHAPMERTTKDTNTSALANILARANTMTANSNRGIKTPELEIFVLTEEVFTILKDHQCLDESDLALIEKVLSRERDPNVILTYEERLRYAEAHVKAQTAFEQLKDRKEI